LNKGDRLAVLVHNGHEFLEIYFAAAKTGAIFCPYNNQMTDKELTNIINYSTPRFLFFHMDYAEKLAAAAKNVSSVERYFCLDGAVHPFAMDYRELLLSGEKDEPAIPVLDDDPVSIFFTAGTTGRPKGAIHTHRHVISNGMAGVIEHKVTYDERVLVSYPMYHIACEDNIGRHTFLPNTLVIRREGKFNPDAVLGQIEKDRITRCQFVPTMIASILQSSNIKSYDLSSLDLILYASAPMPVDLLRQALDRFNCPFAQMYGQTESGPTISILSPQDHVRNPTKKQLVRLGSAGKPVFIYEARIVDNQDNDVDTAEVGEIIVRSEANMKGYWELPKETEEKIRGGWLHTGDLGRIDADGYLYVVGRMDDMIISGGVNIHPREVEEVLYSHPAILETAVIGVPDAYWGEALKAVVVVKPGASLSAQDVIGFCSERMAGFKKPKSVDFWQELPKSPQGKILKKEIRRAFIVKE
jgi:acyl-CoA synthetase (AMP-forming)/AMP-acid ligase II